jgi:tetratricopeptide (TPR) repeat protein
MAQYQRAIGCFEEALRLARDNNEKQGEAAWLGNLGNCIAELGQNSRAIEYFEQALAILREVGDKEGEATALDNLGNRYTEIGQLARAVDLHKQALDIDRQTKNKASEAIHLANLGQTYDYLGRAIEALKCFEESLAIAREIVYRLAEAGVLAYTGDLYIVLGRRDKAFEVLKQSIEIADEIEHVQIQKLARTSAAIAYLYDGDLMAARVMAEAADRHRFQVEDAQTSCVLGIVACRQEDLGVAREAFTAAIVKADEQLGMTPDLYAALDVKALALCGLALCANPGQIPAARTAFIAARSVTGAAGVVTKVSQLFDALAVGDVNHILADLRPVAVRSG